MKSVHSAEKYVVTDKQQPLTWKKKLQYITLFFGVAILLVILVVIAVITSGSIKEDDTGTSDIKLYMTRIITQKPHKLIISESVEC